MQVLKSIYIIFQSNYTHSNKMCSLEIPDGSSCAPSLLSKCIESPVQNQKLAITCKLTRKIIDNISQITQSCQTSILVRMYM